MSEQAEHPGEDEESFTDSAEVQPPETAYPTPEAIEAAAKTGRDLIDHPEEVGVDRGSEAYTSWESADGLRSRREFERVGEQAFLRVARQSDWDESRLVPAAVETITTQAQLGRQGRAVAGGHIIISGGDVILVEYIDFLDHSNDLSATREALEMAQLVVDGAVEQLKSEGQTPTTP